MAEITVACPITGRPVSTDVAADEETFRMMVETLPDFPATVWCPHCRTTHAWTMKESWLRSDHERLTHLAHELDELQYVGLFP